MIVIMIMIQFLHLPLQAFTLVEGDFFNELARFDAGSA